ncbi:hypothetical protein AKJ16_DCAP20691, partial [Drosera capensis]
GQPGRTQQQTQQKQRAKQGEGSLKGETEAYLSTRTLAMDWQPPGTKDCMFTAIFRLCMLCLR